MRLNGLMATYLVCYIGCGCYVRYKAEAAQSIAPPETDIVVLIVQVGNLDKGEPKILVLSA